VVRMGHWKDSSGDTKLILLIIYSADLELILEGHGLSLHQYADDSQICGSCRAAATSYI